MEINLAQGDELFESWSLNKNMAQTRFSVKRRLIRKREMNSKNSHKKKEVFDSLERNWYEAHNDDDYHRS